MDTFINILCYVGLGLAGLCLLALVVAMGFWPKKIETMKVFTIIMYILLGIAITAVGLGF